jgi:hypothetical protein
MIILVEHLQLVIIVEPLVSQATHLVSLRTVLSALEILSFVTKS